MEESNAKPENKDDPSKNIAASKASTAEDKSILKKIDEKELDELWELFSSGKFETKDETKEKKEDELIVEPSLTEEECDLADQNAVINESINQQPEDVDNINETVSVNIMEQTVVVEERQEEEQEEEEEDEEEDGPEGMVKQNLKKVKSLFKKMIEIFENESDDEEYVPFKPEYSSGEDSDDSEDDAFVHLKDAVGPQGNTEIVTENKLTELWNKFDNFKSKKTETSKKDEPVASTTKCKKEYRFAGETIVVNEKVESEPEDAKSGSKGLKRKKNLSTLLNPTKTTKISTLKKTLIDWNEFKEQNELVDEMSDNRKSNKSYIKQQDFLGRTDNRLFELEKAEREKERLQRELQNPGKK